MYKFNIEIDSENIKEGDVTIHFEADDDTVKDISIKAADKWDALAGIMYLIKTCYYDNLEFSKEQLMYAFNATLEEDYEEENEQNEEIIYEGTIALEKEEAERFKNLIEKVVKRGKENN